MFQSKKILIYLYNTKYILSGCCGEDCSCQENNNTNNDHKKKTNKIEQSRVSFLKGKHLEKEIFSEMVNNLYTAFNEVKNDFFMGSHKNILNVISNHQLGFENLKNTCYYNSGLQTLTHSFSFIEKVITWIYNLRDNRETLKKRPITLSFFMLLYSIYEKMTNNDSSVNIKNNLYNLLYFFIFADAKTHIWTNDRYNRFSIPNQNDADEFMTQLFEDMYEENERNVGGDKIPIDNLFHYLSNTNYKLECNHPCNCKKQKNSVLYVDTHKANDNEKLSKLVSIALKKETETIDDYKCVQCNKKTKLVKETEKDIKQEYLLIGIKRFDPITLMKINTKIEIDNKIQVGKFTYTLKSGIIQYSEATTSGHYYNLTKINNTWYLFDDHSVYQKNEEEAKKIIKNACLIQYQKNE